ncbi:MAG: DUF3841 domain-containing protein [Faecousia sp.]
MKLWTTQTNEVWQLLNEQGVTRVKKEFICKKYKESAWSFLIAYDFMSRKLVRRVPQPEGAESPVWLFADPKWAGDHPVPLDVPEEEILLFDLRKWYRVLSLSYVGTEPEEADFDRMLKRQGIRDSIEVFRTPFYPLQKRQILSSWERIFCLPEDPQFYQAACWQLKKEWRL